MSNNIIDELFEKPEVKKKKGKKPINVFAALFFLTLGFVFLLNNFGYLPWDVWSVLWKFWPIFLIMGGLQILANKSWIASAIVFGIGVGLIGTVILYSLSATNPNVADYVDSKLPFINSLRKYIPTNPGNLVNNKFLIRSGNFEDIDKVILEMDLGAGRFNLEDSEEDFFIKVDANYYEDYGQPQINTEQKGSTLIIKMNSIRSKRKFLGGINELEYDIDIGNNAIAKDIKLDVSAGKLDAEIDNTEIHSFVSNLGTGTINIEFDNQSMPQDKMDLQVGAGSMNIHLPSDIFAKFEYTMGVGLLNIDGKRLRGAGEYTIENFSISEDPLPVKVNIGAGTVNINF